MIKIFIDKRIFDGGLLGHDMNCDEVTAKELKSGDLIRMNEYDEPLEVYRIIEY